MYSDKGKSMAKGNGMFSSRHRACLLVGMVLIGLVIVVYNSDFLDEPPHPDRRPWSAPPEDPNRYSLLFEGPQGEVMLRAELDPVKTVEGLRKDGKSESRVQLAGGLSSNSDSDSLTTTAEFSGLTELQFNERCLDPLESKMIGRSIKDTYKKVESMRKSQDPLCQAILKIFDDLIELEKITTTLKLPKPFQKQVQAWLGNDDELFNQIYHQEVFKVVSRLTGEETIYNLLRSKRPVSKSGINPLEYVENLTRSTEAACDFCKYREHTAEDVFGRIESKYSASASNTFKLASFHGLFFPLSHHPLNISYKVLEDLFLNTSVQWFQKAFETDGTQIYPSLLWDSLPHAGASQVHPHVHGMLDSKQYAGIFETIHKHAIDYYRLRNRSVWADFVTVHMALGLGLREGNAFAIVPLTARKDHEFWILSEKLNTDVIKLLHRILRAYSEKLNVFCHSSGAAYPPLTKPSQIKDDPLDGLPVIFRIGSRGDCTTDRSDVSSLELYTLNNINTNLAHTMEALEGTSGGS